MQTILRQAVSLLTVVVFILSPFSFVQANEIVQSSSQMGTDEEEITQAALDAVGSQSGVIPPGYGAVIVDNIQIEGSQALVLMSSMPEDPPQDANFVPPYILYAIAQNEGLGWKITLETDPAYPDLLNDLSDTLLSDERKLTLAAYASALTQPPQLAAQTIYSIPHLPFAEDASWIYYQGPRGTFTHSKNSSAFDFGPIENATGSIYAADSGTVVYPHSTCLGIQRSDGLIFWYEHLSEGDVKRWTADQNIAAGTELGKTTLSDGCGGSPHGIHHVHFEVVDRSGAPWHERDIDFNGSSINGWVNTDANLVKDNISASPSKKTILLHSHNTTPIPPTPPPPSGKAWMTDQFNVLFPWYYLISTGDSRVLTVKLDGELQFQSPGCAKARWIGIGNHTLQYEYQVGVDVPKLHRQPWPFISPACAAEPSGQPPSQSTPPPPSAPPSDNASYDADLTLPDGSTLSPNQGVTKTWRLRNTGSSTWGTGYKLAFLRGDRMNSPAMVDVAGTGPGGTVVVNVSLVTPGQDGSYSGYWRLRSPQGTYFGPEIWAKLNVKTPNLTTIPQLTTDPASPSNTTAVTIRAKVENISNFRALRIKIDDTVKYEIGAKEANYSWSTSGYQPGDHSITVEVADSSDPSWSHPLVRSITYRLTGTSTGVNHSPNRPTLNSPYDWLVYYSGNTAYLCANNQGDPDGDAITGYYFEVSGAQNWSSGWVGSSCVTTGGLGPYNYEWRVRVRDNRGAESDWSDKWHFTLVNPNLTITDLHFEPQDGAAERVKIRACTSGQGGVGITLRVSVNDKIDGTGGQDQWHIIHELGVPCYNDVDAPIWTTLENSTGPHRVRVEAHGSSTGWNGATVREEVFNVPEHRPNGVGLVAPIPASQNAREAIYLNSLDATFQWRSTLRAQNYTLHIATTPNPATSSNPLYRQTFPVNQLQAMVHFTQPYANLYWQVTTSNGTGSNGSGDQLFGIDTTAPTCTVSPLPATTTSTDFSVAWVPSDNLSGIRGVDIQYMDGERGTWQDWLTAVPGSQLSATFKGQFGHAYSFRCRASDKANNTPEFSSDMTSFISVSQTQTQADLEIEQVQAFPEAGGGTLVVVTVHNRGTASTGNGFFTDLYLNHVPTGKGDFTGSLQFWVNDQIPADGHATLTARIINMTQLGLQPAAAGGEVSTMLYVQTDSTGSLNESNSLNNISEGFEICFASGDIYEGDNSYTSAVTLQSPQVHNLHQVGDEDWIKFTAVKDVTYNISTGNLGIAADTVLYLYDSDGTTLLTSNDDNGTDSSSRIEWRATKNGTLYVQVRQYSPVAGGCKANYTIQFGNFSSNQIFIPLVTR